MSVNGQQHAHRPSLFKLPQKKHSTGRHRSKRTIARENRGNGCNGKTQGKGKELKRTERRNRLAQIRANKTAKLEQNWDEKQSPIIITIISFDNKCSTRNIIETLNSVDSEAIVNKNEAKRFFHLGVPRLKSRYTFLTPDTNSTAEILDCLRIADLLLLFWPIGDDDIKMSQKLLLNSILAQGNPQTLHVVSGMPRCGKQRDSLRKSLQKAMKNWTKENSNFFELNNEQDALQLLRQISTMRKSYSNLQKMKPYLIADNIVTVENKEDNSFSSLIVSGFLRGNPMNINNLVYITGLGDFQLEQIIVEPDPYPLKHAMNKMEGKGIRKLQPDPSKQIPNDSEVIPNQMDTDQPCPDDIEDKFTLQKMKKRVPKGTSEYQASWLIDDENEEIEDEDSEEDEEETKQNDVAESKMNDNSQSDLLEEIEEQSSDKDDGEMSVNTSAIDMDELATAENELKDKSQMEQFKQERENYKWPDEVETPMDMNARERFQRYRGLKSFRTSPWNPEENLPPEYTRIYKLADLKRTQKIALSEFKKERAAISEDEYCVPGSFVTLHIKDVPSQFCESLLPGTYLTIFGLLRQEHRMTVLNILLQKHPSCTFPIKNKDPLIFQVGCRRFTANPLFSQHSNGQKFKMERFMPTSGAFCATVYAPITYKPANVVVFQQSSTTRKLHLVAHGFVLDVNPDRIILKRAVLSGHPFKVNKRTAVVRYMFFNREDIEWFKPVELYTHKGRHGRIKQALGTHGLMKCTFDHPMNVQDSVLMNLYKRVFPKWTYNATVGIGQKFPMTTDEENLIHRDEGSKTVKFQSPCVDVIMDE